MIRLTSLNDDAEMLAAWQRFAYDHWTAPGDVPATDQSNADEKLLAEGVAHTPHGAALKLRYAMWCRATEPFLMAASLGADVPNIGELIHMADTEIETIWSSIQSLEAMGARP